MIIWLAEKYSKGWEKPSRVGINGRGIVVLQDPWEALNMRPMVLLKEYQGEYVELWDDSPLLRFSVCGLHITKHLATEHEVTEALDEFLQRDLDLPYVRMEPEEIFAALPEWTRINTLDWEPEGVKG